MRSEAVREAGATGARADQPGTVCPTLVSSCLLSSNFDDEADLQKSWCTLSWSYSQTTVQRSWRRRERADARRVVCELPQRGPCPDLLLQPWPPSHFRPPKVAHLFRKT